MPLISVIIPVKDRPDQLRRAISSVLNQSDMDAEILVIENNSVQPDGVRAVVESFSNDSVKFFSLKECSNANVARNFGVSVSAGRYITYLDSDDEYLHNHLYSSYRLLEESNADFLYGSTYVFNGSELRLVPAKGLEKNDTGISYIFGTPRGVAQTNSFFMRREIFKKIEWDNELARHQDYDFFISATESCRVVCKQEATVKVNWEKGQRRVYSPEAMRVFYHKWSTKMSSRQKAVYSYDKVKLAVINRDVNGVLYFVRVFVGAGLSCFRDKF